MASKEADKLADQAKHHHGESDKHHADAIKQDKKMSAEWDKRTYEEKRHDRVNEVAAVESKLRREAKDKAAAALANLEVANKIRDPRAPKESRPDPKDPRGGYYRDTGNEDTGYYYHSPESFEGKPPTQQERKKMYVALTLRDFEDEASIALAEGRGIRYSLDALPPREREHAQKLIDTAKHLGIGSTKERRRWESIANAWEDHEAPENHYLPREHWAGEEKWFDGNKTGVSKPKSMSADEHKRRAKALASEVEAREAAGASHMSVKPLRQLAEDHWRTAGELASEHATERSVGEEFSISLRDREADVLRDAGFTMPPKGAQPDTRTKVGHQAKALYDQHGQWGTMTAKEKTAFKRKLTAAAKKVTAGDIDAQTYLDVISQRTGHDIKYKFGKSLEGRMQDRLQKAKPSAALPKGGKPIPKGMKFGSSGAGKEKMAVKPRPASDKPAPGPVQGSVVKPPAGFTPIPHSKKGGYHKQMGGGKYIYWYPGQGIVGQAHEADSEATPHQEETAKHVMDQITALEAKGSISKEELEHTKAAIRNAWPAGPQDVPRHIMDHYQKLQGMVPGEDEKPAAAEKPPKGKEAKAKEGEGKEGEVPEVKIKRPGEAPMTTKELRDKMAQKKAVGAAKKETRAAAKEEKRKKARSEVITDPKKVPEGFNKLDKMERAKLTANWDQVREDLESNYTKGDYMSHPDMAQAITEHIDELAELGHIVPANTGRAKGMILTQLREGEKAGIKKEALASLLEENVRKLAHQEVESSMRTLGDHGVRHLAVNAHQANRIFDQLAAGGIKITPMQRFMAGQVMLDHDMGYTIPVIAKGGFAIKDKYHPQASAVLVKQQAAKYRKLFGAKGFKEFMRHVETHSGSAVDWKKDPVGSAVRLADNSHLFADKMPEVLFDTNAGIEVMTKIKLADDVVPKSLETVDDDGNTVMTRTPEEKAEFKALIGGVKGQLADAVKARTDLPKRTKALLAKAVNEVGAMTPKFLVSRLAGRAPTFSFNKKSGDMTVDVEQSPARKAIGEIFGDDQTDKQFGKMLEDYGKGPKDALDKKPPPPGVRVGDAGNGIDFAWSPPKGDHPTEKRYAQVMRDTKARLTEIQAMTGPAKSASLKKFFGTELQKAMAELEREWAAQGAELRKSAMSAMAARSGRARPSAYAPIHDKPSLKERIGSALGRRPKGTGWTPVPGGKKGGFRKMVGGRWSYWYPGMGESGGSEKQAAAHQAKKEIAHHDQQADKWQKKTSKRLDQGQHRDHVQSARDKRDQHIAQARKLRDQHGIKKSQRALELELMIKSEENPMRKNSPVPIPTKKSKKSKEEEEEAKKATPVTKAAVAPVPLPVGKGGEGNDTLKSVMVGSCQVHLTPDQALSKALEDGHMGIGTVARTHSSKAMIRKSVGGEGYSEHGQDHRETVARAQQDAEIVRMDPAGNCGNGGLPEWFKDAQSTQEPMVRAPAVMAKAQQPAINVIDDSDPYTRRLHQADPRDHSAADIDYAYNRDAKRTK